MVVCSFGMTAKIKLLHLFTILNQSSWQKAGVRRRKRRRGWQQIDVCPVMRSRHTQTHSPDSMKRKQQFFSSVCVLQHAQLTGHIFTKWFSSHWRYRKIFGLWTIHNVHQQIFPQGPSGSDPAVSCRCDGSHTWPLHQLCVNMHIYWTHTHTHNRSPGKALT